MHQVCLNGLFIRNTVISGGVSRGDSELTSKGLACADPGARTPIGVSGNFLYFSIFVGAAAVVVTLLAFSPEGIVVGF